MIQDRAIVTKKGEQETVPKLWNVTCNADFKVTMLFNRK